MLRLSLIGLHTILVVVYASAQQVVPSADSLQVNSEPERVSVYGADPGVTLPVLLPLSPVSSLIEKCKEHVDGRVLLSLLVDTSGHARNIMLIDPVGKEIDRFAIRIAAADRFTPGSVEGKPVAVAESLEVIIQSCFVEEKDGAGKKSYSLKLMSTPIQTLAPVAGQPSEAVLSTDVAPDSAHEGSSKSANVGGRVSAPVPILQPLAEYTDEARRKRIEGVCLVSTIVDAYGMPQNVHVLKSLNPGLDENAIAAVYKYRFKPAMRDGEPVPVYVKVVVNFRLTP